MHSRPYNAFYIWMYKSGFHLLLIMKYFWYILGANFTMISAISPSRNMLAPSSVSMWIYAPGISNVATSRPSCASTDLVMNTDSVATVGEATSYLFIVSICFIKSAHAHTFMYLLRFYFRNIINATTSALWFFVSFAVSTEAKVYMKFICVSYFMTYSLPHSLNFIKPVLR